MKYATVGDEISSVDGLPPCGGSGLKCIGDIIPDESSESPSMRREWIEISKLSLRVDKHNVSLHAEGVD